MKCRCRAIPSNDQLKPSYDVGSTVRFLSQPITIFRLTVDPNNPEIFYLGGTADGNDSGLIRIDVSGVYDSHAVVGYSNSRNDGGTVTVKSTGRTPVVNNTYIDPTVRGSDHRRSRSGPYTNVIQNPGEPFTSNSTVNVYNVAAFTNDGSGVTWTPLDQLLLANPTRPRSLQQRSHRDQHDRSRDGENPADLRRRSRRVHRCRRCRTDRSIPASAPTSPPRMPATAISRSLRILYGAAQPSSTLINAQVASSLYFANGLSLGETGSDPERPDQWQHHRPGSTNGAMLGNPGFLPEFRR